MWFFRLFNDNRKQLLKSSTELLRGRSQELQEIGRILFGDKKKMILKVKSIQN